jgi:predicted alpha/beta-fold hydrolase
MKIKQFSELFSKLNKLNSFITSRSKGQQGYKPTPYLTHPFLQSIYNISEPLQAYEFEREKIFFEDGGHISLDWCAKKQSNPNPPILFIMHGLTGGSEMNYIKVLMGEASKDGFKSVCMNSRGINN